MSIMSCHDCEKYCDIDFGEGEFIEIGNMRRQHCEVFVCQQCLEARIQEDEWQEEQGARAAEDAERENNAQD